MNGKDFYYNGHWLSDFGMMMFDPNDTQSFVGRTIDKANITPARQIPNHYSTYYSDVLTLSFLIIKDEENGGNILCENGTNITDENGNNLIVEINYLSQEGKKLTGEDINVIRAWLESPKTPEKFFSLLEDDVVSTYYFGVFSNVQPFIVGTECFGLYLTFSCNAPYGFSDVYKDNILLQNGTEKTVVITNYSAERNEYTKPIIIIKSSSTFGDNNTIKITNVSDGNKFMLLTMPKNLTSVTIDCQKKIIKDNDGNILTLNDVGLSLPISNEYNFISSELYIFYWLRLLPDENTLKILPSLGSTIQSLEIQARYIIKSGGF